MKNSSKAAALMLGLCLLSASLALGNQILEGDANVDQRNYPSTAPFIHPPFYNVKVSVEVDDSASSPPSRTTAPGWKGPFRRETKNSGQTKTSPTSMPQ